MSNIPEFAQEDCKVLSPKCKYRLTAEFRTPEADHGWLIRSPRCSTPSLSSTTLASGGGVRHPFTAILALAFLGLLCRETDFASLRRWAADHWRVLKPALGFTRKRPSHATTLSRVLARFSLEQFRNAFAWWLARLPQTAAAAAVAVAADGKTSEQGHDAHGDPVHMLNLFAHELGLCLGQFPVTGGKPTEPQALKAALAELIEQYPMLRLFTTDALFTQRPLARVILEADRDFLFAVKDNQPDLHEAVQTSFRTAADRPADVKITEKTGAKSTPAGPGFWRARRWPISARRPRSPASS